MPTLYIPTAELVAIWWLKSVAEVPVDQVAGTVPARSEEFAQNGFVQVQSAGGDRDIDTFMRNSDIQIDCWAYNADSQKVPWGKANQLAEQVLAGTLHPARVVELPESYDNALVRSVYPIAEPQRIPSEGDFARYSFNLTFVWTPVQK